MVALPSEKTIFSFRQPANNLLNFSFGLFEYRIISLEIFSVLEKVLGWNKRKISPAHIVYILNINWIRQ